MIHIVTASNRHLYRAQLAEMHRLRRVHFVEERGWRELTVIDGGEYDQFDDERTVYILALGPEAGVLGGMRARPTDDKCMLADVFPDLIGPDQPPVCGPGVWEISRIFTTRAARSMKKSGAANITLEILLAAMEWTQDGGVDRLVGVIDLPMYAPSRERGWNIHMTGLPLDLPDGPVIGIEIANTVADIEAFRRMNGRRGRSGYMVTDADIAAFGDLAKIEAEFAVVRADGRLMPGEAARGSETVAAPAVVRSPPAEDLPRLSPAATPEEVAAQLSAHGVVVIEGLLDPARLKQLKGQLAPWFAAAEVGEGPFFGRRTRRFGSLLAKAPASAELALEPLALGPIEALLKADGACDEIELNLTQAIAIDPGEAAQVLHRDETLWPVRLAFERMANVMWALDDFTLENGATRLIPGSHLWDRTRAPAPGEAVAATAPAGSAVIWLGGVLHGGGANRSDAVRHGLVVSYRLGWLAPAERLQLVTPRATAAALPERLQRLLGYQLHRPNLGWIEGQDPIRWLRGEVADLAPTADNFPPEMAGMFEALLHDPAFAGYRD
ncbi:MAG: phytanoyl-CoA dioxygenase family protein [Caulobacteraceae bacterium]|nr:phytanoyl-CoA dioxygenase family protein [Caulobacteraceae bacterium]